MKHRSLRTRTCESFFFGTEVSNEETEAKAKGYQHDATYFFSFGDMAGSGDE